MRIFGFVIFLLSFTITIFSQQNPVNNSSSPSFEIVAHHWRKANSPPNLDPGANIGGMARTGAAAPPSGQSQVQTDDRGRIVIDKSTYKMPVKGFQYSVTVKNLADRKIKHLVWEYIFIDPETNEVVDRHTFTSLEKIGRGKQKKLSQFDISPPTKVVDANLVKKTGENPYIEKIVITHIEYAKK